MKFLFVTLSLMLFTQGAIASPDRALLYSSHAVLVTSDTPEAVQSYLAREWGALVYVLSDKPFSTQSPVYRHNRVILPRLPSDSAAASIQLKAWMEQFGITVAIFDQVGTTNNRAAIARAVGLRVFESASTFGVGDIAIPLGRAYQIYHGDGEAIFQGNMPSADASVETAEATGSNLGFWIDRLAAEFDGGDAGRAFMQLAGAISYADSLGAVSHAAASLARRHAAHWRAFLAFSLAPDPWADTLELNVGVPHTRTLSIASAAGQTFAIRSINAVDSKHQIAWHSGFPFEAGGKGRKGLTGSIDARTAGRGMLWLDLDCQYQSIQFTNRVAIPVNVEPALEFELIPPILYASNAFRRSDPDYVVNTIVSELNIRNWTRAPLTFDLSWTSDRSIDVSATLTEYTLSAGGQMTIPITVSMPRQLDAREYEFSAGATYGAGYQIVAKGQVWQNDPIIAGDPLVGVLGGSETWLKALKSIGIAAISLHPDGLSRNDLNRFRAIIIPAESSAPALVSREAITEFVRQGKMVVVDLSIGSARWLPWNTPLVSRPGPFEATFYKPDFSWWQTPNGLVGGCYASSDANPTATLPAGIDGWDPLVVDQNGKGFMYRRNAGRGWYVAVHPGWGRRLANLNRRALLGLINLVGR